MRKKAHRGQLMPSSVQEYSNLEAHETFWLVEPLPVMISHGVATNLMALLLNNSKSKDAQFTDVDMCNAIRNNDMATCQFLLDNIHKMQCNDYSRVLVYVLQKNSLTLLNKFTLAIQTGRVHLTNDTIRDVLHMALRYDCSTSILNTIDNLWQLNS